MSLVWKSQRPTVPGWYWVREGDGREFVVEYRIERGVLKAMWSGEFVAFAGPLAKPVEPTKESLATLRYRLDGTCAPPDRHYWSNNEWAFVSRAEILRRARVHLCGDKQYYTQPVEADSVEVVLWTNRRAGGRWQRRSEREVFTAETIDAAIAKCQATPQEVRA